MNPESLLWRRLFPLACGACAIVVTPAYGDILYTIPTFATGPGAAGKSYDPAIVSVATHNGISGTTAAQLLALQTLNPAAGTSTTSPRFQNNVTVDATQTAGTLLTDVGVSNASYFQFGAVADPGAFIYPTTLTFDTRRATTVAGSDRQYSVQVSVNGSPFTTIASQVPVTAVRGAAATHVTVPLMADTLQGGDQLDFRILTVGAGPLEYTNFVLNGTVDLPGPSVEQTSAALTVTGGTIVLTDIGGAVVNPAGITIALTTGGANVPATVTATKTGIVTTVKVTAAIAANQSYDYTLTVPRSSGGDPDIFTGTLTSYKLPTNLAGLAGTVGTWGIREYKVGAGGNQAALTAIAASPAFDEESSAVFNRRDPDTNNDTSCGQFNNDSPILTDDLGDQSLIVVGKTKVTVAAAGDYTFAVHSDDGFAMRVTGPSGGRFTSANGDNNGSGIDKGDNQTLFFDGGTGDSNMHGVYHFDAAGTYDITYLGYDGGGGAFYEVAWAPGAFTADLQTNTWTLVGTPGDPSVLPFRDRFSPTLPGVAGTAGNWGIRTYLNAQGVGSATQASDFLKSTTRLPTDANGLTIDVQRPVLNATDPDTNPAGGGVALPDQAFPGNTSADDNNVVTVAKSRLNITSGGTYTFQYRGDDGFFLRIKGAGATATPSFRQVVDSGNRDMSHPNEWFSDNNGGTRAVIDLPAGTYDLEYVQFENTGGYYYELTAAAGEWPTGTPPNGWQLVGDTTAYGTVNVPKIASPGWTVETSQPDLMTINLTVADAEASISATEALDPVPNGTITTWNNLNFTDPQATNEGSFSPSNPFPMNTSSPDNNYAMRATGQLVVTVAGEYQLGYQGDDGCYMIINGPGNPFFKSIVSTNHPNDAKLREEEVGVTGRNNMMVTEVSSPNCRTVGAVDLQVGTYTIKTLMFQGTGNSFWEVFGAQTTAAPAFNLPLLSTDGPATVAVPSGLALVAQVSPVATPFNITGFTTTGSPASGVSFTFSSANAGTYAVQVSNDLVNWSTVTATITDNGNGTSGVTANFAGQTVGGQPIAGQPKLFVRVVRTF
ncbi:MAG: hypothetical protein JWO82_1863 [Akkermansiaceae bacterium]|nr:hypothetical protein [Akkermansiaceae bacterium]